jgi:hypothetical protein
MLVSGTEAAPSLPLLLSGFQQEEKQDVLSVSLEFKNIAGTGPPSTLLDQYLRHSSDVNKLTGTKREKRLYQDHSRTSK